MLSKYLVMWYEKRDQIPKVTMIEITTHICAYEFRNTPQDTRLVTIRPHKIVTGYPTFRSHLTSIYS